MAGPPGRGDAGALDGDPLAGGPAAPCSSGVTAKTVANHKSNVAAALRWFGKEYNVPSRGVALLAEWAVLRDGIGDRGRGAVSTV